MANCIIHPIPIYQVELEERDVADHLDFAHELVRVSYAWYVEGTTEKILVDTGGDIEPVRRIPTRNPQEIQTIDSGLRKLGLSFDDIDLIILTHLHFDHVAQARRYPRARFLVQKDELCFARNPHPLFAGLYRKEYIDGISFEVIDGDTKICEEISVISTPGHSPGGQSVSVKTAQGIAIIPSLCSVRENFEPPSPINNTMPVIPPSLHISVIDTYDSLLKIKEKADIIVPNHDPEFLHRRSIP